MVADWVLLWSNVHSMMISLDMTSPSRSSECNGNLMTCLILSLLSKSSADIECSTMADGSKGTHAHVHAHVHVYVHVVFNFVFCRVNDFPSVDRSTPAGAIRCLRAVCCVLRAVCCVLRAHRSSLIALRSLLFALRSLPFALRMDDVRHDLAMISP